MSASISTSTSSHEHIPSKSVFETADNFLPRLQGLSPDHFSLLREVAQKQLKQLGLPNAKMEAWKFSNLARFLASFAGQVQPAQLHISGFEAENFSPSAQEFAHPSVALLNQSSLSLAKLIVFQKNKKYAEPILIDWAQESSSLQSARLKIVVEAGSEAVIVEHHAGQAQSYKNLQVDIEVQENAKLTHIRFIEDDSTAVELCQLNVALKRDAIYNHFALTTGNQFSRHQFHARLTGQNAHLGLYGISLLRGSQHGDTTILIEHEAPNCQSNQLFKTICDDQARGVFQGKIHVHQIAQKTDGYQFSGNILLSPKAEMNVKPELEIYADDVKCSHGTTTGSLDETPLFYMQARGIPEDQAKRLLIEATLGEVIDRLHDHEEWQNVILSKVQSWLNRS
jgi:Fe-S cluster assembly protein SufD